MKKLFIGIDIGGTRTKIGLVDLDRASIIRLNIAPTETRTAERFLESICSEVLALKNYAASISGEISGIGIGIPGFVDRDGIVDTTYDFLPFMENFPVTALLADRLNLAVKADNDARLIALGEAIFGAGKSYERVLVLTLGTGLGVGFVCGKVLSEPVPYGHMAGHLSIVGDDHQAVCYCGRPGCLEALVSATGLRKLAMRLQWDQHCPGLPLDTETIFEASRDGNILAAKLIDRWKSYLKIGIANFLNIYTPDVVILGGGLAKGLQDVSMLRQPELLYAFRHYTPSIVKSELQESAGVLGSAALFHS